MVDAFSRSCDSFGYFLMPVQERHTMGRDGAGISPSADLGYKPLFSQRNFFALKNQLVNSTQLTIFSSLFFLLSSQSLTLCYFFGAPI